MKTNKKTNKRIRIIILWLRLSPLYIKSFFNEKAKLGLIFYVLFSMVIWGISELYLNINPDVKTNINNNVKKITNNFTPSKKGKKEIVKEVSENVVKQKNTNEANAKNQIIKLVYDFKLKNNVTSLKTFSKTADPLILEELKELNLKISMIYLTEVLHKMDNAPDKVIQFLDVEKINTALMEQIKFGIPTSITLSQAASESGWGTSKHSLKYNNYFGVKCKDGDNSCVTLATEEHYTKEQYESIRKKRKVELKNTKNDGGKKIYVCIIYDKFRTYPSFWHSFRDHSLFLYKNDRYAKLFQSTSYIDWCHSFRPKRDGGVPYATSMYKSNTLKSIIEKYNLFILDF